MQNGQDLTLRMMIVDDDGEHAEAVVASLRNGGVAVRPLRPYTPQDVAAILGGPIDLVLSGHSAEIPLAALQQQILASGKDIPLILLSDHVDETEWIEATALGIRAIALRHRPEHLLAVIHSETADLQARRQLRRVEAQMRETERRCDALIASSRDPIAYVHEGMHIRANAAYLEMFGFSSFDAAEGVSLLDLIAPRQVGDFKQRLQSMSRGEPPPSRYQVDARNLEGSIFPATLEFATATYAGEPCIQVVFRRREEPGTELARAVEDLRQRDQVTGLLNRPAFMLALEDAVAKAGRNDGQYGFLLIEPDHYARLLPEIGLDAADALIAAMAALLMATLEPDVSSARFGEHSFALLLSGGHARSHALAESIRTTFAQHVLGIGQRSATVTVSIGGVQIGEKIASIGQVLGRATEAQRAVARLGGNAVNIFDPGAVDRAEEERVQHWVQRLRQALAGDGFRLHYQPVLHLRGESMELYQTSLRLEHDGQLISPSAFIGIAEDHSLIAEIDRWVVEHAIQRIGERQRAGHATHMIVRIDPASFSTPGLIASIREQLAAYDLPGERLWLQTPESKVFTHLRSAQRFLAEASALGCKVGLEQFGAGLDSFQLLAHFRPDFLELDHDLTAEIASNRESRDKLRDITARAQPAGIATIAGSVTDATSMSGFFNARVDYVQGDFIATAGPAMQYEFA